MAQYPASVDVASLDGSNGFKLTGGSKIAPAGDVNGDGFIDLIVGSPGEGGSGASFVVFGKASGFAANTVLTALDGTNGFRISGVAAGDSAGFSVASAGDVNGDGLADMIIGAPNADPHAPSTGSAYVVFARSSGFGANVNLSSLDGTNGFRLDGQVPGGNASHGSAQTGFSVASAGDINGDGFADVIIGAPGYGVDIGNDANGNPVPFRDYGASYVVFGKAAGFAATLDLSSLNGSNGFRLRGDLYSDFNGHLIPSRTGYSVASAGDVNADGFADMITGAPGAGGPASGAAYLVYGQAGSFPANIQVSASQNLSGGFKFKGESSFSYAGSSVAPGGDINGDGFADFLIGAPAARPGGLMSPRDGAAYVVFGQAAAFAGNPGLSSQVQLVGNISDGIQDSTGISVASAGDFNGDGFDDVIVGTGTGASYVVFGKPGFTSFDLPTVDGTNGLKITGAGNPVGPAGDVNHDGFADLMVGNPGTNASYVILGREPDAAVTRSGTDASQTIAGGEFNDVLSGLGGNDHLYGHGGNDILNGGAGDDSLTGGAGMDVLDGGAGENTATYGDSSDAVQVNLAVGSGIGGDAHGDVLIGIQDVVGSAFGDVLTGDAGFNKLFGGGGNDFLIGGGGPDLLDGGGGTDTAFYDSSPDAVRVDLTSTLGTGADAQQDVLHDIENVSGSGFADLLIGNAGANRLSGGAGNDALAGGAGADILDGGADSDTALYDTSPDAVQVNLAAGAGLNGDAQGDVLISVENVVGSAFGDVLTGDGNDNRLNGGRGADLLTGAAGNDTFVFVVGQANGDTVVDFSGNGDAAGDSLELVGYGADATFTQVDGSHWQVNYHGGTEHDVITFLNGAAGAIHPSDFVFV